LFIINKYNNCADTKACFGRIGGGGSKDPSGGGGKGGGGKEPGAGDIPDSGQTSATQPPSGDDGLVGMIHYELVHIHQCSMCRRIEEHGAIP
jgi:hypothetical protein